MELMNKELTYCPAAFVDRLLPLVISYGIELTKDTLWGDNMAVDNPPLRVEYPAAVKELIPTNTDCFKFIVENLMSCTPKNFMEEYKDTGLTAFEFGILVFSISKTLATLPPLTTSGGFCIESIRELVVGSTYAPKVSGIAVVLTRSVL